MNSSGFQQSVIGRFIKLAARGGALLVGWISTLAGGVQRTVADKLNDQVSVFDFMTAAQIADVKAGTLTLDMTAAINAALAVSSNVMVPQGSYKTTSTILIPAGKTLRGAGVAATIFVVSADVVGFRLNGQSAVVDSFAVTKSGTHTNNGIEVGDAAAANARLCSIRDVSVTGMGNDGIRIRQGNIGHITNVACISNGRDGIHFGIETVNANAWTIDGFNSLQANVRDGLNFESASSQSDPLASRSHTVLSICSQSNGRYGVYIGTPGNVLTVYIEASTTKDLYLDSFAYGNMVTCAQQSGWTDVGLGTTFNRIINQNASAGRWRQEEGKVLFAGGTGNGIRISNSDGTAGVLDLEKTGAATYAFKGATTGQNQTLQFINTGGAFYLNLQPGTVFPIDATVSIGTNTNPWNLGWFNSLVLKGAPANPGAGTVTIGGTVGTVVGAAGGASALPATPLGYINAYVNGSPVRIPYYN